MSSSAVLSSSAFEPDNSETVFRLTLYAMPFLSMMYRLIATGLALFCMVLAYGHNGDTSKGASGYLFEENLGQFNPNVLYRCRLPTGFLFLEKRGLRYLLEDEGDKHELMRRFHNYNFIGPEPEFTMHSHAFFIQFIEGNSDVVLEASQSESYFFNYFLGNNPEAWQTGVKSYKKLRYIQLYKGIDLVIYTGDDGLLKFDWEISEAGNPTDIQMFYDGVDSLNVSEGMLNIHTSVAHFKESPPIIAAKDHGIFGETTPECHFRIVNRMVGFSIENVDDIQGPYTIDPALIFSTYSGSRGDNFGFTATYDSRGNLYAGGITNGNEGPYPVTTGAIQTKYGGGAGFSPANLPCDITISKYDSAGTSLLWATYVGGSLDEYPHSLVTDRDDDLLIFGTTYSDNYPTSANAYDKTFNGEVDIIVTKISADGTKLLGSTYVGGSANDGLNSNTALRYNYADDFRGDIIPDEDKHVYIASCTESDDFPRVNAIDTTQKFQDGCILELSPDLSQLLWSTYLGGSGRDALYSIKVDADSFIYVGGGTSSSDLVQTDSVLSKTYHGSVDGFVARLNRKQRTLSKLTYWGTPSYDQVYFIDLDYKGHVYISGQTTGNIEPSAGVYGTDNRGQFIAKLDTSLNAIKWQTSFGVRKNQIDISPSAFLVDNCEHIYVSGWGSNVRPDLNPGSTVNLETTSNAVQSKTDGNDFYILVLNKDAKGLLYATYFGGDSTDDHVDGGTSRFDKKGVIYQSVCSSCPNGSEPGHQDFPITPGAAFPTNFSPRCSNASFKIDLQIRSAVDAYFVPDPIIGCNPVKVNFDNRSDIAQRFIWDFGDGTYDSTNLNPTHTYDKPGDYIITLTVIDSNTCNISDKFRRSVRVIGNGEADFDFKLNGCTQEAEFTAKSKGLTYLWVLGDGDSADVPNFKHTYPPGGSYDVWFYVNPGTLCADSIKKQVNTNNPDNRELIIPNVFTPNGDGFNDYYCLQGFTPDCDEIEMWVYNRWGELVFKTNDIRDCWDGSVKNSPQLYPPGTYFYLLKVLYGDTGNVDTTHGTITLIRD